MAVSVIIPVYNRAALLGATLESILAQTQPADEILVVDDGSTDDTVAVAQRYAEASHGMVRVLTQPNAGPSAARNLGLEQARGEWIAFCDADDLWLPRKLELQVAALQKLPTAGGVYCRMFKFQHALDDLGRAEPQDRITLPGGLAGVEHILLTMCIQSSTALLRRAAIGDVRFDVNLRAAEDALFFAEVGLRADWAFVDEALVAYRVHEVQLTKEAWHALRTTEARVAWCRRMAGTLGPERAQAWEDRLWAKLIEGVEKRYWQRQLDDLPKLCQYLQNACPQIFSRSFLSRKRIWPKWIYRIKDALTLS